MSVFKLCGRPLRGYLLTPQTSALGMRDGVGNVPEPPAPTRWASPARVDRPLRHGTERGAAAGRTDVQTAEGPGTAAGLFLPTISPRQAQSGDRGV